MDPVGFALGVIAAFKDIYLASKFVYDTVNSGLKYQEERQEVVKDLRREILFLRSFGRWFAESRGMVTNDAALNQFWLEDLRETLEEMKDDLAEYRNVAEKYDKQYQQYSPVLHASMRTSGRIEFDLSQEPAPISQGSILNKVFGSKPFKDTSIYVGSEWALFRKRKLEKLVGRFQKRNKMLRNILQIGIAAHIQSNSYSEKTTAKWLQSSDIEEMGLTGHVQIARLQHSGEIDVPALRLIDAQVSSTAGSDLSVIHQGQLVSMKAKNNASKQRVLVEYKELGPQNVDNEESRRTSIALQKIVKTHDVQIEELAALLYSSGRHKLGTLPLKGFTYQAEASRHAFVFSYPEGADSGLEPETLYSIIERSHNDPNIAPWSLEQRFHTAYRLAEILGSFNNDGWVHKSVRSASVAFFHNRGDKKLMLNSPFLVNFEYSRLHDKTTYLERDESMEKDLYRHPTLQESQRQDSFSRVHDVYALGVILLEIALWRTAAVMVDEGTNETQRQNPAAIRRLYLKINGIEVPWRMGQAYADAITACLDDSYAEDFILPEKDTFRKHVLGNLTPRALHRDWS